MNEKETHPFEPYVPENATKLIIGTIPPPRFAQKRLSDKDVNFYYGSEDNNFWDIVGFINDIDFKKENSLQEVEKRKKFLDENKIGICDIVKTTKRKKKESASDKDLDPTEYLNIIDDILTQHTKIDTLIYTSDYVKECMTRLLKQIFNKEICHSFTKEDKRKGTLIINNKQYDFVILYSPSRKALQNMGKDGKEKRLQQYRQVLGTR